MTIALYYYIDRDLQQFSRFFFELIKTNQSIQTISPDYYYYLIQRLVKNILF